MYLHAASSRSALQDLEVGDDHGCTQHDYYGMFLTFGVSDSRAGPAA
jgi:hypothetical protein